MKHRVKKFASLALAFAMLGSSVFSGGVNSVFASTSDSDDDIVISSEYQTNDDEIEIADVEEKAGASVSIADLGIEADGIDIEVENIYKAGDAVSLQVNAFNNQEKDSVLRVYFWDYAEKLPDDTEEWNRLLNVPCTDIGISNLDEASQITVALNSETEEISEKAVFVQKMDEDRVSACYLEVSLLSGFNVDFVLDVYTEMAQTVTVVPVIVTAGEERCFEPEIISWESEDADISIEAETEAEAETEVEIESEDDQIVIESETPADTFASVYLGDTVKTDGLNASDFASMRLILLTDDADVIADKSDVIGQYDNIYLLEFTSIQQTMNAYVYYKDKVSAVEPDIIVETASDDDTIEKESDASIPMSEEENPIRALSEAEALPEVQEAHGVIALIDTGVKEHENIIDRVSVIDDVLEGNGHGDYVLNAIVSQDEEAQILSIRAIGDNELGTVSSLVAAMEYAIEQKVDMINLSLYAKSTLATSVLKQEILKATEAGITVIGSAGNSSADVVDYIPGSVEEAIVIGAADETGARQKFSNYGATVDYNVVAGSTSEAAGIFTGFLSANGLESVGTVLNQGLIYATDYAADNEDSENTDESLDSTEPVEADDAHTITKFLVTGAELNTTKKDEEAVLDTLPSVVRVTLQNGDTQDIPVTWKCEEDYANTDLDTYTFRCVLTDGYVLGDELEETDLPYYLVNVNVKDMSDDAIMLAGLWNANTSGTVSLPQSLGVTGDYVSYLEQNRNMYLGTPYNGDIRNTANSGTPGVGLNCTGFVGHVLRANGADLSKITSTNTPGYYGPKTWTNLTLWTYYMINNNAVQSYRFNSCKQALDSGVMTKGDIIIMEPSSDVWTAGHDRYGNAADCHIGFFWGDNPHDNKFWHSSHATVGIEGSNRIVYAGTNPGNQISNMAPKCESYIYVVKASGYLKVHKDSALPDITNGNSCYSLKGAVYGVYKTKANAKADTNRVTTLTTDANGDTSAVALIPRTYYVKEITAPTGYELDENVYTATVTVNNTTSKPVTINSEDTPGNDPTGIQITKIWNGAETPTIPTLEGTQFTIKYYDGYYTKSTLPSTETREWVIEVKQAFNGMYIAMLDSKYIVSDLSDELYYDGDAVVLPYGTITIQETKPAAGYTPKGYLTDSNGNTVSTDSELYVSQVTKDGGMVKLNGGNVYSASDTPIYGSIKIKKYDTDGKTALQGVTFEIVNSAGKTVATKTTDKNGEILFDNLYPDVYTITETATVSGHTLLKDPITAEIPMRVTEQDIKDNNIDKNQCIYDAADNVYYIHNLTYEVGNSATFKYPMTGGFDTMWTYLPLIAGFVILAGMSGVMLRRKRRM